MNKHKWQQTFLNRLSPHEQIASLFEYLPEIYLYVKNQHSQFILVNQTLLNLMGVRCLEDILGKTDADVFQNGIGEKYIEEDRLVMKSNKPLPNQIWLVPNNDGSLAWYISTKIPLHDIDGNVCGIAGVMRGYDKVGAFLKPYDQMSTVIEYINSHFAESISVNHLAEMVHLSISQFDRNFHKLFQMPPKDYITRIRIQHACHQLIQTDNTITQIALECGFYDHSYFTKMFKRTIGLTPKDYRKHYIQIPE